MGIPRYTEGLNMTHQLEQGSTPSFNKKVCFIALWLVLFLDGLGQGVIYPALGSSLLLGHSNLFAPRASLFELDVIYGVVLAVFFICWFFGAAFLGDVSDNIGRKKTLLIILTGMAIGNLVSAFAFDFNNLFLVFLGRVIVGLSAGSQAIAQASIIDMSESKYRARNMGLILLGVMGGLTSGPAIGGLLADSRIVSWFSMDTPLYFTAILAFINLLLLYFFFSETNKTIKHHPIRFIRAVLVFVEALKRKEIRSILIMFIFFQFAWVIFYLDIPIYIAKLLGGGADTIAVYMVVIGLGTCVGSVALPHLFSKLFHNDAVSTLIGYGVFSLVFILFMLISNETLRYFLAFIGPTFLMVGYTYIIKIFSSHVSSDEQGEW